MLGLGNNFAAAFNGVDVAGSTQCQTCNRIITFYGYIPSEFYCPNCGQSTRMNVTMGKPRYKYDKNGNIITEEKQA